MTNLGVKPPVEGTDAALPSGKLPSKSRYPNAVSNRPSDHNAFTASTRSRRSCCSEHDPPPHWFTAEIPPIVLHLLGTFLALLAGLFLSVGGLVIGKIQTLKPLEISGLRSLIACIYLVPLLLYFRPKHDFGRRMMVETLGVSLIFCVKFVTFSVGSTLLPLSEFSLLCNTVPVFTAFFGCVLLAEKCGLREWLSCLIVMLGVATTFVPKLIQGDPNLSQAKALIASQTTEGYIITAASAMSNAMALCWLRRLKEVHSLLIAFYACLITAAVSLAASFLFGQYRPPTDYHDLLLVAVAALCMLSQALLPAIACSLTQASRVAVAMTFSVVFAFLLQAIFLGEQPTVFAIGGGVLIVLAMVVGNTPCGDENDEELLKEDGLSRSSRYGSMSAAMDSVR